MKTLLKTHNGYSVQQALTMSKDDLILVLTEYNEQHNLPLIDFGSASEDDLRKDYLTKIFDLKYN